MGSVDASKTTAKAVLNSGRSIFVYPGGEMEQMLTAEHQHRCYVNSRKGFCRLAVEFGIPVIPHYTFGETGQYSISHLFYGARMWLCRRLHIALPLAFGRSSIPFPFGLPKVHPQGMNMCVGQPVYPNSKIDPKTDKIAFDQEVNSVHARYLVALQAVFDENKAACGYATAEIELLPKIV